MLKYKLRVLLQLQHKKMNNMKKLFLMGCAVLLTAQLFAQSTSFVGDWTTVDDKTGEKRSVVHIYKATDGMFYGKIIDLLQGPKDIVCDLCSDNDHNKPIVGLVIVRGMKEQDGELVGGKVLDPESGKFYYCKMSIKDGKLVLRGSLDKRGMLGRNQTWIRNK